MKQVNDATKIIQELLDRGKTIGEIADYMAVERRTVLHWKQGYRIIWGGRIGPNQRGQLKILPAHLITA